MERLTMHWFTTNSDLQVNASETQEMTLGKSLATNLGDKCIEFERILKILGVTLDRALPFKPHIAMMLQKAKTAALWRITRLVPSDVMISLYKACVLTHLEYCCPLLLGKSKGLKYNVESTNHYAIKTLLGI